MFLIEQRVQFYLRRLHGMSKQLNPSYAQFFNILELISHYETVDQELIINQVNAFSRKAKKNKKESVFFLRMLDFFSDLIQKEPFKKEVVQAFRKDIRDQYNEDGLMNLLNEFILDDWLKSLEYDTKYSNMVKNRYNTI